MWPILWQMWEVDKMGHPWDRPLSPHWLLRQLSPEWLQVAWVDQGQPSVCWVQHVPGAGRETVRQEQEWAPEGTGLPDWVDMSFCWLWGATAVRSWWLDSAFPFGSAQSLLCCSSLQETPRGWHQMAANAIVMRHSASPGSWCYDLVHFCWLSCTNGPKSPWQRLPMGLADCLSEQNVQAMKVISGGFYFLCQTSLHPCCFWWSRNRAGGSTCLRGFLVQESFHASDWCMSGQALALCCLKNSGYRFFNYML